MSLLSRLGLVATALLAASAIGWACSPGTPATLPTGTPAGIGPPATESTRIVEHIRVLSDEIGTRLAGSAQEQEAIDYAREQFESWGYGVEVQAFPASSELLRNASVAVEGTRAPAFRAVPFFGSASGDAGGQLVDAGTGRAEDFPAAAAGAIVLIQRRDVTFTDMAQRAQDAGAAGVVVANKEPGIFQGGFDPRRDLPFVAIDQADGEALRGLLAQGDVRLTVHVDPVREMTAHNVIARPPNEPCRTLSGGHYDSVAVTAGAVDNASGSATVLELARAAAAADLHDNCFALFGAEEIGLVGSEFFVSQMSEKDRGDLEVMFNYDAAANGATLLIGDADLANQARALATRLGISAEISSLPEGASSDHASFAEADFPALMFTADFNGIHVASDNFANLDPAFIGPIATLGFALLEEAAAAP